MGTSFQNTPIFDQYLINSRRNRYVHFKYGISPNSMAILGSLQHLLDGKQNTTSSCHSLGTQVIHPLNISGVTKFQVFKSLIQPPSPFPLSAPTLLPHPNKNLTQTQNQLPNLLQCEKFREQCSSHKLIRWPGEERAVKYEARMKKLMTSDSV